MICPDNAYHALLHRRQRAKAVSGHANWRKCQFCKRYDDTANMYVQPNNGDARHRACFNRYHHQQRKERTP